MQGVWVDVSVAELADMLAVVWVESTVMPVSDCGSKYFPLCSRTTAQQWMEPRRMLAAHLANKIQGTFAVESVMEVEIK